MKKDFDVTRLYPDQEFSRHIFHRDQFAHYLRWTHVLKLSKVGMKILDFGCGTGSLLEVMYRNKFRPKKYVGIDVQESAIEKAKNNFDLDFAEFYCANLTEDKEKLKAIYDEYGTFDIVASFEVIEHVNKNNAKKYLKFLKAFCNNDTIVLLSTPIYDEKVGAAKNHIIDGVVQEYTYDELKEVLIESGFEIVDTFGTFASQKDYKPYMNEWQTKMFDHLKKYYDSNLVSNLMAPFFPEQSRNCLWRLKKREKN